MFSLPLSGSTSRDGHEFPGATVSHMWHSRNSFKSNTFITT